MAVGDRVHPNGADDAAVALPAGWMQVVVEGDPVANAVIAFIAGEPLRDPTEVYGQHAMPPHTPAYWHDDPNETGIHPWWRILAKGASRCGNKFGFTEWWCEQLYKEINKHGHGLEEQFVHESHTMVKART
eukprot:gene27132-27385_t